MSRRLLIIVVIIAVQAIPAAAQSGPADPAELEAFIDGMMSAHMEGHSIPGAVVVVVKNGRPFFAKGYGYADLERRVRVDPERTPFRIGSVTKLFTWTAVMQLVEQGKLDLNVDVNTYLSRFKIPPTYPQPITMAHLMSHTAGFEDKLVGLFARSSEGLKPLGDLLAADPPARERPPGQLPAYSNRGAALAGFVVEEITGMAWEDYVEVNIFKPLGMTRSTPRQPLPPDLASEAANGYKHSRGMYVLEEFEYVSTAPAGAISATAADMAKFMVAHLQRGRYGDTQILRADTVEQMHRVHFRPHPLASGMAHGFVEQQLNGQRIIGHGGDTILFHTELMLIPLHGLGVFVSYNSPGGAEARGEFIKGFLDRYFPVPAPLSRKPAPEAGQYGRYAGSYGPTRVEHTGIGKLAALIQSISVRDNGDGTLLIPYPPGKIKRWVEVQPAVFREIDGQDAVIFVEATGSVDRLVVQNLPVLAFVRQAWYETPAFHNMLSLTAFVLLLSTLIWPVHAIRNIRQPHPRVRGPRLARWVAGGTGAAFIGFIILFLVAMRDPVEIVFGVPPLLPEALTFALVGAVLTPVTVVAAVFAWRGNYWRLRSRIHYTLVAFAGLAFVWWLNYWNLLGFRF